MPIHLWVKPGVPAVRAVETPLVDHYTSLLIKSTVLIILPPTQVRDVQHRGIEREPLSWLSELRA